MPVGRRGEIDPCRYPITGGRVTPTATAGFAAADRRPLRAAAILGVLGVVYGDIGTSPLYALKASLGHFTGRASAAPRCWASCR